MTKEEAIEIRDYTRENIDDIIANCDSPLCTRMGFKGPESLGQCIGMHCFYCGEPCSSQGHFNCPVREALEND